MTTIPVEHLGSFSEVMNYVGRVGWTRSQLTMRLLRERRERPDGRGPNDCPRPIHRVSNGKTPLWDLREWDEYVKAVKPGAYR